MPIIRTLAPDELVKYRDHLLRSLREDRRLRFGNVLDDAGIEGFVLSLQSNDNRILVVEDETTRVVSAVQIALREAPECRTGVFGGRRVSPARHRPRSGEAGHPLGA